MANRKNVHVVQRGDQWGTLREGGQRASQVFDTQAQALKRYANDRGIAIMGDLPIFIAHHSADCWSRPDLYSLDDQCQPTIVAGCPPDAMAPTGQRWGNPLYRWAAHAADGFAWWTRRLRAQLAQADMVRIDHFRGFAAYWEVAADAPDAVNGVWRPGPGAALFEAFDRALGAPAIIAEDLGTITPDVIALRDRFALPGMRVLQFAFDSDAHNTYLPHNYVPNTVVYTGTHDNDTACGWFAARTDEMRERVRTYLGVDGRDIHWRLIHAASMSVAGLAIYPFQDVLGLDSSARMNRPGLADGCWDWRFEWSQVEPGHAEGLRRISAAHGRNGL